MAPASGPRSFASDDALIERIERAATAAVPAEDTWGPAGWLCQYGAAGQVGRVNSATVAPWLARDGGKAAGAAPCGSGAVPEQEAAWPARELATVSEVAGSYETRGLTPRFRLSPLAPTSTLRELAEAGYSFGRPVLVMSLDLAGGAGEVAKGDGVSVVLEPEAADAWRQVYTGAYEAGEASARLALALASPGPRRFAVASDGGAMAGVGLGVCVAGAAGVFDVLTLPAHRRRGVASAVVGSLLEWATAEGADLAYLQVAADNAPAMRLYERLGFVGCYSYLYAVSPAASAPSR